MSERHTVKVVIRCKHNGYAFDLEAEPYVDHIPGLIEKLESVGIEPGNSPYLWEGQGEARSSNVAQPSRPKPPMRPDPPSTPTLPKRHDGPTENQIKAIFGIARSVGFNGREEILRYASDLIGREVESIDDLTKKEASDVISALKEFE